jgi:hypothetical protein
MLNHCKWIADAMLQFTCSQGYGLLLINRTTKKGLQQGFSASVFKKKGYSEGRITLVASRRSSREDEHSVCGMAKARCLVTTWRKQ